MESRKRKLKIGRSQDGVDMAFMHEEFNGLIATCLQIFFYYSNPSFGLSAYIKTKFKFLYIYIKQNYIILIIIVKDKLS